MKLGPYQEVIKSGFHKSLISLVNKGMPYDEILATYSNQLGYEAQAILRALIMNRDSGA